MSGTFDKCQARTKNGDSNSSTNSINGSATIGRSHHDTPARVADMAGPQPAFFFAPTQVKKRVQDWGARGYQERVVAALGGFVDWSRTWLRVQHAHGAAAATATWSEVHAGRTAADIGHVVSLWD